MTEFNQNEEEVDSSEEGLFEDIPRSEAETEVAALFQQVHGGASWFYWIAGLSILNSAILLFGGDVSFIVGLGITQATGVIAAEVAKNQDGNVGFIIELIAFAVTLVAAGLFIFFGVFAKKRHLWAFIVGMILYACDGLLFLLIMDLLSVGFHVFALFCIFSGLSAAWKLNEVEAQATYVET